MPVLSLRAGDVTLGPPLTRTVSWVEVQDAGVSVVWSTGERSWLERHDSLTVLHRVPLPPAPQPKEEASSDNDSD